MRWHILTYMGACFFNKKRALRVLSLMVRGSTEHTAVAFGRNVKLKRVYGTSYPHQESQRVNP